MTTTDNPKKLTTPIVILHKETPAMTGLSDYQHECDQVIFVQNGVLSVINEHGRYIVPPQQAIFIPANTPLELVAKSDVLLSFLYFEPAEATDFPNATCVLSISAFVCALLLESHVITNDYSWQGSEGRLLRLIRDYLVKAPTLDTFLPYPSDQRLTNITDKLLKHPSLKSDLNSWGNFVNASSRTLSRIFKKETGITYSTWRQKLNVQIAIKHLAAGDSVSYIANLLGYESSSAFIYMFKKQMGISPNQFLQPSTSSHQ
ncbi:helix-turn-helix transcriptional regulator [Thalassotalea sp. G2M2-11]|uniref:AraC family transcriptional regulator n=1 Tax=Thalassotalea sp. G2M2-11 TaxID=2787627 RepID=UPI0019D0C792|nr:helix-turn-helix transcriptional regulator [Thalassotalea sp. G2M2-11]